MLFGVITCLVSVILLGIDGQFVDSDTYPKVSQKVNRTLKPPDVVGGAKVGLSVIQKVNRTEME